MIVFHRTDKASHDTIVREGRFTSRELGEVCVSDMRDGYATGYGDSVVTLSIPDHLLVPDDEFQTGETHYRIKARDILPEFILTSANRPCDYALCSLPRDHRTGDNPTPCRSRKRG